MASGCYQLPLLVLVPIAAASTHCCPVPTAATSTDCSPAAILPMPNILSICMMAFVSVSTPSYLRLPRICCCLIARKRQRNKKSNFPCGLIRFGVAISRCVIAKWLQLPGRAWPGLRREPQPGLAKNSNFQLWREKKSEPNFSFSDELSAKTDSARFSMSEQTLSSAASPTPSCLPPLLAMALSSARETAWPIPTSGQTGIRCSVGDGEGARREGSVRYLCPGIDWFSGSIVSR